MKLSLPVFPHLAEAELFGVIWKKVLTAKRMVAPFCRFFSPLSFFLKPGCDSTDQMLLFPCMQTCWKTWEYSGINKRNK